ARRDSAVSWEPVRPAEGTIPEESTGPVPAALNPRRAEIDKIDARGKLSLIAARVPLARMFDYSDKIRSLTQGRAGWTMEPHAYAPAPDDVLRGLLGTGEFE